MKKFVSPLVSNPTSFKEEDEKRVDIEDSRKTNYSTKEEGAYTTKNLNRTPSIDINESADAFIKKFRQQLLIQRMESIENYQQMLARGQ